MVLKCLVDRVDKIKLFKMIIGEKYWDGLKMIDFEIIEC